MRISGFGATSRLPETLLQARQLDIQKAQQREEVARRRQDLALAIAGLTRQGVTDLLQVPGQIQELSLAPRRIATEERGLDIAEAYNRGRLALDREEMQMRERLGMERLKQGLNINVNPQGFSGRLGPGEQVPFGMSLGETLRGEQQPSPQSTPSTPNQISSPLEDKTALYGRTGEILKNLLSHEFGYAPTEITSEADIADILGAPGGVKGFLTPKEESDRLRAYKLAYIYGILAKEGVPEEHLEAAADIILKGLGDVGQELPVPPETPEAFYPGTSPDYIEKRRLMDEYVRNMLEAFKSRAPYPQGFVGPQLPDQALPLPEISPEVWRLLEQMAK